MAKVHDGLVHIAYEVRPEVCGSGVDDDGAGMFALLPTDKWKPASSDEMAAFYSFDPDDFSRLALNPNPSWTDKCVRGPGHLLLEVRRGRVASLQIAVGTPVRVQFDHDIGRFRSRSRELPDRAGNAGGQDGRDECDSRRSHVGGAATLYRDLVRIAADPSRPESVRGTALHWAALDPTPGAAKQIRENAASMPQAKDRKAEEEPYRRAAIGESNAYSYRPKNRREVSGGSCNRQSPALETRKKMISWLHEHEPASSRRFMSTSTTANEAVPRRVFAKSTTRKSHGSSMHIAETTQRRPADCSAGIIARAHQLRWRARIGQNLQRYLLYIEGEGEGEE